MFYKTKSDITQSSGAKNGEVLSKAWESGWRPKTANIDPRKMSGIEEAPGLLEKITAYMDEQFPGWQANHSEPVQNKKPQPYYA